MAARVRAPFGVIFEQLDIEPVEAAGGADVKGVFADLPDGADAGKREEEAEMIGKVGVIAGHHFTTGEVFGLEGVAIGGEDEFGFGLGSSRAGFERGEGLGDLAGGDGGDVDVVGLQYAAGNVRFVGVAAT
ncbi:MAG: hypothetical protein LBV44_07065 [Methylobacillus sp.]|nr:hypothetical protein [Methylobacillus sp.]